MFRQSKYHPDIFSLIDKIPFGCWLWKGYIDNAPNHGYGRYGRGKNRKQAHRLIYELFRGSIPPELKLDHLCRVRHCVNPEHLEPVSSRTNLLRGHGLAAINARKTHCPKGHEYEVFNGRERICLPCKRERNKLWMRNYKKETK